MTLQVTKFRGSSQISDLIEHIQKNLQTSALCSSFKVKDCNSHSFRQMALLFIVHAGNQHFETNGIQGELFVIKSWHLFWILSEGEIISVMNITNEKLVDSQQKLVQLGSQVQG
jgi:hypothetical protein